MHILTSSAWEQARVRGAHAPESLAREGFIHLSSPEQVLGTANRFYRGVPDLVVLVVEEDALGGDLRWEEGEPGELFPHLYRPLAVSEVVAVRLLVPDGGGRFCAPPT